MRGSEHPVTRGDQVHAVGAILGLLWVLGILVSVDPFFHKKKLLFYDCWYNDRYKPC